MTQPTENQVLSAAVEALGESAAAHKRLANLHREAARKARRRQDELIERLTELGIKVEIQNG